jgi:hypothetical protein
MIATKAKSKKCMRDRKYSKNWQKIGKKLANKHLKKSCRKVVKSCQKVA